MLIRCKSCFQEYNEDFGLCPFCGYADGEPPEKPFCLSPGMVIAGRYIIGKELNSGGFGIVYKAWDKKLDTIVAIKEYYPSGLVNRQPGSTDVMLVATKREREFIYGKTRFLEEARNLAKFSDHKNIVNVYDFFESNNTAYIVMEYLDGKNLSQVLDEQNVPLPYDYCINVAAQVGTALKAIHKENILHRDISPDNIMVCNDGTIKLFDFGAARFSANVENRVTIVVKPGYAPPEQYDKVNRQDPRTDIYALGATLYHAMTGVTPEESTNRKIEDKLSAPTAIDKNIPENISNAIMRAMAVEQQYRFSTVDEFVNALTKGKKVASVQKERAKRRRRRVTGILVSFMIIAGAVAAFFYMLNERILPDATLDLWYVQTGNTEADERKANALEDIIESFILTNKYSDIEIKLSGIPSENYLSSLMEATETGQVPAIFESTGLDISNFAVTLPDNILNSENSDFVVPTTEGDQTKYSTGIIAPIIYINSTMGSLESADTLEAILQCSNEQNLSVAMDIAVSGMYKQIYGSGVEQYVSHTAKEDFINRTAAICLGSSSDYADVQEALPGEYQIMLPDCGLMTYQYGTQWSIANADNDTMKVSTAFLNYLTSPLAQDYFHIQNQSGELPIVKSSLSEYTQIFGELNMLPEYFTLPAILSSSNITSEDSQKDSVLIPQKIVQNYLYGTDLLPDEYSPSITFYEDMHCDLYLNMAEWLQNISATYKVYSYQDETKVIKCTLDNYDLGDNLQRNLHDFILVQTTENNWVFYGQLMGLTFSGDVFVATDSNMIDVQSEENKMYSPTVGEYKDNEFGTFYVLEYNAGQDIRFAVDWYRWTGMDATDATLYGNFAVFDYSTEDGHNKTLGYIELTTPETIVLTLTESGLPFMDPSIYTYEYMSPEDLKLQETEFVKSILLFNNDVYGWCKTGYGDFGNDYHSEIYIRFFEDGTLKYWICDDPNTEAMYTEYAGTYEVDEDMLYINGCAYDIFAEFMGRTSFLIYATTDDTLHLNGDYIWSENIMYQALVS